MAAGVDRSRLTLPAAGRSSRLPRSAIALPLVVFWPGALLLVQATLARSASFDLTVGVVGCHALQAWFIVLADFRRPPVVQLVVILILLLQVMVLGSMAADHGEFARSFAQVVNLALMVLIAANLKVRDWRPVKRSIAVFLAMGIALAGLIVAQFVAFNLFHDLSLARPLGDYAPAIAPGSNRFYLPSEAPPLRRPNGLFAEPSVAGWFLILVAAIALSVRSALPRLAGAAAAAAVAGAAMTLSLTGILGISTLVAAYLLFVRDSRRFKLALLALVVALGALAATSGIAAGLLGRADEVHRPGSSTYVRFVAPIDVVIGSLRDSPLGTALGQTPAIAELRDVAALLGGSEPAFDNTLFTIVLHFGLIGVLLNLGYLLELLRWLVIGRRALGLILLALLLMLTATGAGWSHQSVMIIGYAILVGRYLLARERAQRQGRAPPPGRGRAVIPPLQPAPRRPQRPEEAPPRAAWLRPGSPL